jgi:large subunit ribosomal protein L25
MAQGRPTLKVEPRELQGSRNTRRLRRQGLVPGVVYGHGEDSRAFQVSAHDLRAMLVSASQFFDLDIAGDAIPVIVKDQQLHPVRSEVMHIDMLRVDLDETIATTVLIELHGGEDAPGVKEGGVLEQVTRELNIEALPGDIPEKIEVDVSGLEAAATLQLSELTAPNGVTFLDDPDETVIATITVPTDVPEEPEIEEETGLVADGDAAGSDEAEAEGATGEESEAGANPPSGPNDS